MPEDQWTGLDAAFAELEAECTSIARGLTVRAWQSVLARTPQYMGRMAASWAYCLNHEAFYDRSDDVDPQGAQLDATRYRGPNEFQPLRRGDTAAIAISNLHNLGKDQDFKLGDVVYITNGVDHGEGAYSQAIEDGEVRLRPANLPGKPQKLTEDYINAYYKDISKAKAMTLKSISIGL